MAAPLPRAVKTLGLVSLLTDASSEMIYPLLPAFLTGTLRAGPAFLGVMEGLAEAVAAFLKLAAGRLADRLPRRKPLVVAGYGLSSLVRPLVALATAAGQVLVIRLLDRVGKGVRGAPRDALLAEVTAEDQRGRAYRLPPRDGPRRGDGRTAPGLGRALLHLGPAHRVRLAAIPAALAMAALVFGVHEEPRPPRPVVGGGGRKRVGPARRCVLIYGCWPSSPWATPATPFCSCAPRRRVLRSRSSPCSGPSTTWSRPPPARGAAPSRTASVVARRSWPAGRSTRCPTPASPGSPRQAEAFLLFALYGLFHALTEGPERALLADFARPEARGRAFGLYHAVTGAMLLPASLLTGVLWQRFGPGVALGTGAALAAIAAGALLLFVPEPRRAG